MSKNNNRVIPVTGSDGLSAYRRLARARDNGNKQIPVTSRHCRGLNERRS
jgi:hypothetical protein